MMTTIVYQFRPSYSFVERNFNSNIFYWITELISIERWEGTIEYTLMGALLIPLGLWVFRQAELYARRTGKLHRNG